MCLGIPGRVIAITDAHNKMGLVEVCGVQRQVHLACVIADGQTVHHCLGAWVLVHVGFAMTRIDEEEARLTLELLEQLGEAQDEIASMRAPALEH
jgi:hydrogenase expression/formation protein HypC